MAMEKIQICSRQWAGLALILLLLNNDRLMANPPPSNARLQEVAHRLTPALKKAMLEREVQLGQPLFIRIFKASHELEVWLESEGEFTLFQNYTICDFSGELGPKLKEGDLQSPEGFYFVTPEQMNPASQYHLSFNLGFPNLYDRTRGQTGSALMVHGNCVSIGCYAMTDPIIEEIYLIADAALRGGQPFFRVHIFPFRMTDHNLHQHRHSPWSSFWENLKQGYDLFEATRRPPNVEVGEGLYQFGPD